MLFSDNLCEHFSLIVSLIDRQRACFGNVVAQESSNEDHLEQLMNKSFKATLMISYRKTEYIIFGGLIIGCDNYAQISWRFHPRCTNNCCSSV